MFSTIAHIARGVSRVTERSKVFFAVAAMSFGSPSFAGSVFITGHDPIWHAGVAGGNTVGATNLALAGINYARNGSALPFLFIESKTVAVPGGNFREASFLTSALGFTAAQYVVMDAADLSALSNFRTTLNSYSAIVIASDHGGMLTGAELGFLNSRSGDVISYLNAGGGLFASSQSNAAGLIGANVPFGFLPFLVASTSFSAAEVGNTVSPLGASLGLTNSDVNGNFSHNFFSATGGMTPVDYFNGDTTKPLSLATRSVITSGGVTSVPDGGDTFLMLAVGFSALMWGLRRKKYHHRN